jgi:hypothetical protein
MTSITLHKAQRVLDAIKKALQTFEPKVLVKISIFSKDIDVELLTRRRAIRQSVETTKRLLQIRQDIRSRIFNANADHGINALLATKYMNDDLVVVLERLPGVTASQKSEDDDTYAMYRRGRKKTPIPEIMDEASVAALVRASAERYGKAEGAVTSEIEIGAVTSEDASDYRRMATESRRAADRASDSLRELNASVHIEVLDEDMNWLTENGIV